MVSNLGRKEGQATVPTTQLSSKEVILIKDGSAVMHSRNLQLSSALHSWQQLAPRDSQNSQLKEHTFNTSTSSTFRLKGRGILPHHLNAASEVSPNLCGRVVHIAVGKTDSNLLTISSKLALNLNGSCLSMANSEALFVTHKGLYTHHK